MSILQQITNETPFFCTGTLKIPEEGLKLFYETIGNRNGNGNGNGDSKCIKFPLSNDKSNDKSNDSNKEPLKSLVENGTPATFGKNFEAVLDTSYRSAKTFHADRFVTTFDQSPVLNTILDQVEYYLLPQKSVSLRCTKYRMNIYEKGGHFKEHQDTPESSNMFGSLVVLLPTTFTGGELVLMKNGIEVSAFKNHNEKKMNEIEWIAFYGDVTHKVTEVLSGTRITLTYKLFNNSSTIERMNFNNKQYMLTNSELECLMIELREEVKNYKEDYEFVGFGCQYEYSKNSINGSDVLSLLKGSDAILYSSLKTLNVNPVISEVYRKLNNSEEAKPICCVCDDDAVDMSQFYCFFDCLYNFNAFDNESFCSNCVLDKTSDYFFERIEYVKEVKAIILDLCKTYNVKDVASLIEEKLKFPPENQLLVKTDDSLNLFLYTSHGREKYKERVLWLSNPCKGNGRWHDQEHVIYGNDPGVMEEYYCHNVILVDYNLFKK